MTRATAISDWLRTSARIPAGRGDAAGRELAASRSAAARRAAVLILTWVGGSIGHEGGDYLVQRDADAQHKQHRSPAGRSALLSHCISYAATQALTKYFDYRVAGERVPLHAQLAGGFTEALLHGLIDDGRLLRAFAVTTGKQRFHDLAEGGLNGRALLDQASHKFLQIPLGAIVTTLLTARADHPASAASLRSGRRVEQNRPSKLEDSSARRTG